MTRVYDIFKKIRVRYSIREVKKIVYLLDPNNSVKLIYEKSSLTSIIVVVSCNNDRNKKQNLKYL